MLKSGQILGAGHRGSTPGTEVEQVEIGLGLGSSREVQEAESGLAFTSLMSAFAIEGVIQATPAS